MRSMRRPPAASVRRSPCRPGSSSRTRSPPSRQAPEPARTGRRCLRCDVPTSTVPLVGPVGDPARPAQDGAPVARDPKRASSAAVHLGSATGSYRRGDVVAASIARACGRSARAPVAMSWTSRLPMAAASTGPESTSRPVAFAVSWQRSPLALPPPTMWIVWIRWSVSSSNRPMTHRYRTARLSRAILTSWPGSTGISRRRSRQWRRVSRSSPRSGQATQVIACR